MGDGDLRILMLEDEPVDAELSQRELRKAGIAFTAQRVATREEFVSALRDFHPDLVLADYSLPSFDGLAALEIVRETAPELPFIFVTGVMGEEFAIETLHHGAADYVLKGRLSKLGPAVTRALEEAAERRARRRAEVELAESEEKFRKMAGSAQDGIAIIDQDGATIYWNRAAERMFGYGEAEMLGKGFHETLVPARFLDGYRRGWPGFRDTGQGPVIGKTLEMAALRKGGEELPVELSISAAPFKGQWHAIGILRDISERKAAERALRRGNRFLRTLSRCNESLVHASDEYALLGEMCRIVVDIGEFPLAWVGYGETADVHRIRPVAQAGVAADAFVGDLHVEWKDGDDCCGPVVRAVRSGDIQVVQDIAAEPGAISWREKALERGYRAVVALPLRVDDRVIGSLNIHSGEQGTFTDEEVQLLEELSGDLAFGISTLRARTLQAENARRLERSLEDTIQAIATTIEARDPYTAGHQHRVSRLAAAIAAQMGLPEMTVVGVQRGGAIHDIGKIYIPAEILNRPGKLTGIEFSLIKTHPEVGYDIVKDVEFPWPVREMILQHHERIDGSGYPHGLKGEQILVEARIIAVADVVEAMMNHRPYRPALGLDAAIEEISRKSGTLFDPQVVEACAKILRHGEFTF